MQHYISDSIYGLTLAWITSENSTKHLDSIFSLDPIFCYGVRSRPHLSVSSRQLSQLLSPTNSLLASRYLFRPRRDFKSKNPLSGFARNQTKESSAWRATYIVLHNYINKQERKGLNICVGEYKNVCEIEKKMFIDVFIGTS